MENIIVFVSQFLLIYLLGFQQLNVVKGYYFLAFMTSLFLGIAGWFTITILSTMNTYEILTITFFAYIISGPIAIVCSMKTHSLMDKRKNAKKYFS